MSNESWIKVCATGDIDDEDVFRFDHGDRTFAIYNLGGEFYATDGYCTHEDQHLADGLVFDGMIECPLHMGQFDIETGKAVAGPVCVNLVTYAVKIEGDQIFLALPGSD